MVVFPPLWYTPTQRATMRRHQCKFIRARRNMKRQVLRSHRRVMWCNLMAKMNAKCGGML